MKAHEENADINSINNLLRNKGENKIILANNLKSIINIKSPIINMNNMNKKNMKKISKEIMLETSKNKNKIKNKYLYGKNQNKNIKTQKNKYLYNMETNEEKNMYKNKLRKNKDLVKLSKGDEDLQEMDYEHAIIYDKRSCLRIYWSYLVEVQITIEVFLKFIDYHIIYIF